MKQVLTLLCAVAALLSVYAEEDVLQETVFADPTSYHSPSVAKNVKTFRELKVYNTQNYPMLILPVSDYDGQSEVNVTIRAARDNSMPAKLGLICQVRDGKTKKMLNSDMQIKNVTEDFADYKFKVNPGKISADCKKFRLMIYTVAKKGNIYLEKITVSVPEK